MLLQVSNAHWEEKRHKTEGGEDWIKSFGQELNQNGSMTADSDNFEFT